MDDSTLIALIMIALAAVYVYAGSAAPGVSIPAVLGGFTDLLPSSPVPIEHPAPAVMAASAPVLSANGPSTIDPSSVEIVNGGDVRSWPQTTLITNIEVAPDNVRIGFTAKDNGQWPDQNLLDNGGMVQYTVWLFLNINGQWVGSGFIQMWGGRDGVGDGIFDFVNNWYYSERWAPMTGHAIQPNEAIGFMVTAGNERDGVSTQLAERSNIVTIPAVSSGSFTF